MSRLDDLIVLRNSVDDEIRDIIPNPRHRTAHQWLLLLPPDLNARLHRAELEAELAAATGGRRSHEGSKSETIRAGNKSAPAARQRCYSGALPTNKESTR